MGNGIKVAVVGLGFGASWVAAYQDHPAVAGVAICDPDAELRGSVAERHGIDATFESFDDLLAAGGYDAVHLLTPIPLHVEQTLAALDAGVHCACAIPMAMSIPELERVVDAQRVSSAIYMLMETAVYSNSALYVRELAETGALGDLQFLRCAHYQNMEGWPAYWEGLPPMYYSTHALGPVLAVAGKAASSVQCLGSGCLPDDLRGEYGNPYPVQTALVRLADSPVVCEVTRCLFEMTRGFQERFDVYGNRMAFEWPQVDGEEPVVFRVDGEPLPPGRRSRPTDIERVTPPDFADRVPEELRGHVRGGAGGNFRPHMVHEFMSAILEKRPPAIDASVAANWTAVGICAHESAMDGGVAVAIPPFGA
ncbi:Gfo/Idh/MocA family oxidoreductase [Candidatus Poribacteria bacterium]|nr:Gfo/Idh/MocA family oxidoreductase [Candidatus Poribacteria bacterium]MBT5532177.1 Gfo/Idh/MocA family oxidoreductase [Candidatus Poribacteria bacterium]MBT5712228.1 Gfo/Idh/MocA family oxidoreductase [Candidatus Poribacteria bacterium]MBT7804244.1 Gfo/Idh/MocA family oxidoreductase [Candidatus Poribacteria bacterium]